MAESSSDSSGGGSWWGGWLQAAKEKSMSAIEMIKKDLEEFSNTMQHDTGEAVAKTTESLRETLKTENTEAAKDKLKQGLASFLDGLTKLLVVEAEDKDKPAERRKTTDPIFDRAKARLHAIQVDPSTYCSSPSGPKEKYEDWLKSFDMDVRKGEISELLVSQVEVRGLYTRLVPSEISHADFWRRYFYKVHQLQIDEARKLALMKRAEQSDKKEDTINWDEEDSSADEEEIKKHISSKKKAETNKLPNLPQNTDDSNKKQEDVLVGTTSDIQVSEESEISLTCTNENNLQKASDDKETFESISSSQQKTDTVQDCDTVNIDTCQSKIEMDIMENLQTCKTENTVSENNTVTNSPYEIQQVESNCTLEKSDKTEMNHSTESETDTVKQTASDEESKEEKEIRTKEKGDVVVVNPDRDSPSTESTKGSADDDWERDFDVELTEEDLKAADEIAKKLNLSSADYTKLSAEMEDDWENWE